MKEKNGSNPEIWITYDHIYFFLKILQWLPLVENFGKCL